MGSTAADAVFDIVRGICTIASGKIMYDVVFNTWADLFQGPCPQCFGHGTMTCPYCEGTKQITRRPVSLVKDAEGVPKHVADPADHFECKYCGDFTDQDKEMESYVTDETDAGRITANFNAATGGALVLPFTWAPAAGTVACETCCGSRIVHRHTPNLRRYFGLEEDFFTQIHKRAGAQWLGTFVRDSNKINFFMEYPAPRPALPDSVINPKAVIHPILLGDRKDDDEDKEREGTEYLNQEDAFQITDFVLPQFDEDKAGSASIVGKSWP